MQSGTVARILLIDDDPLVLETLTGGLIAAGHEVVPASDGDEGLALLSRESIDIVVTDIIMPRREGIETILELRARQADVPIIAISGGGRNSNLQFLKVAEKLGATRTLQKPFSLSRLNQLIAECLTPE